MVSLATSPPQSLTHQNTAKVWLTRGGGCQDKAVSRTRGGGMYDQNKIHHNNPTIGSTPPPDIPLASQLASEVFEISPPHFF